MSSSRSALVLLCTLAVAGAYVGCKKKPSSGAEPAGSASTSDSSSAPADSGSAAAPASASASGSASSAPSDSASAAPSGSAAPDSSGSGATPTSPPSGGGGAGFAGRYACFGGLTLSQTGNGVSGSAVNVVGNTTTNWDINCTAIGNMCTGFASKFVSNNGKPPKPAGRQKVTFKVVANGLDYTEGGVAGFCSRK